MLVAPGRVFVFVTVPVSQHTLRNINACQPLNTSTGADEYTYPQGGRVSVMMTPLITPVAIATTEARREKRISKSED